MTDLKLYPSARLDLLQVDMQNVNKVLFEASPFAKSSSKSLEQDIIQMLNECNFNLRKSYSQEDYLLAVLGHDFFVPIFSRFYDQTDTHQKEIQKTRDDFEHLMKVKHKIEKPLQIYLDDCSQVDDKTAIKDLPSLMSYPHFDSKGKLLNRVESVAKEHLGKFANDQSATQHYDTLAYSILCPPAFGSKKDFLVEYEELRHKYQVRSRFVLLLPEL